MGTLLINELWEIFRKRKTPKEFYLIVDECQLYFTPDIAEILEQASKYGLHIMLFHQHIGQVPATHVSALTNAQTKIEFHSKEFMPTERRFMLTRRNGVRHIDDVPLVHKYPLKPETVGKYAKQLLKNYLSIEELDTALLDKALNNGSSQKQNDEIEEEDFFRR